jgi:putative SOS response-associated peptidase YedK
MTCSINLKEEVGILCGRFTLYATNEELEKRFQVSLDGPFEKSYNIAPTQMVLGIVSNQGERQVAFFRWGLIPFWAKDAKMGHRMINARAETVHEKPSFRRLLQRKRCLIPSDGFFEWKQTASGKQPYYIHLKEGSLFSFAGLWDTWKDGDQEIHSCTIITTQANELMKSLHHRMPVIFEPEQEEIWLDRSIGDAEALQSLLTPLADQKLEAYPVSARVNSPKNNHAELLQPI